MRAVVVGAGAVGARAARQLLSRHDLELLRVVDLDRSRSDAVVQSLGHPAAGGEQLEPLGRGDVAVLACPGPQRPLAEVALAAGAHVVSLSDDPAEVRALLALDAEARERSLSVVVGAGFSPGLACLLARHAAAHFDEVDEIHVARAGTGGPACARRYHRALRGQAVDWRDGAWVPRSRGWGRELSWFPDPLGGVECVRADLAEPVLLVPAFPGVARVTARLAASRRERVLAPLPRLRRPRAEGELGGLRVEVRGRKGTARDVSVLGALDRPAVAAGAVAAVAAEWAVDERYARPGAAGLAELVGVALPFLQELARRGVRAALFEGV